MALVIRTQGRRAASAPSSGETIPREEIARVAYELFQRRGGQHGHDREDWLEAERLVRQRRPPRAARRW